MEDKPKAITISEGFVDNMIVNATNCINHVNALLSYCNDDYLIKQRIKYQAQLELLEYFKLLFK